MIYYIRHGQTDDNLNHIYSGSGRDVLLNKTGLEQAKQLAQKLKKLKIDIIFCSPMKRAKQMLNKILEVQKNVPIIFDRRIIERFHGDLEGKPDTTANIWNNESEKIYHMETMEEMFNRVANFYDQILKDYPNKNFLIVSHSGIGRMTYSYFYGKPKNNDYSLQKELDNAKIMKISDKIIDNKLLKK